MDTTEEKWILCPNCGAKTQAGGAVILKGKREKHGFQYRISSLHIGTVI